MGIHSIKTPLAIRWMVDTKGQIRAQRYSPMLTTPVHRDWHELQALYNAQGFPAGWRVFLEWADALDKAIASGQLEAIPAPLPDAWLPRKVLELRAAAVPKRWEPPPPANGLGCVGPRAPDDNPERGMKRSKRS